MSQAQAVRNPFPGLRPFEFDESHLFFGREGRSEELARKLTEARFAAAVGASGSGKSSLVRAGLLPLLLGGAAPRAGHRWRVAVMRPGVQPIHNLAESLDVAAEVGREEEEAAGGGTEAVLRRSSLGLVQYARDSVAYGENLLVVVDQFEEIFRPIRGKAEYEDEAAAFVKLLLEAARQMESPVYVILTMRSDYLGDCDRFRDLPEAVNAGQYLIPRLTRDEYRQTVVGPARVSGAEVSARLVNRLLNDVGDSSGNLPIFQHALMRTWDHWRRDGSPSEPLDFRHYEAAGGVGRALSIQADEVYEELAEGQRAVAEKMFKALTEMERDYREVRRPSTVEELMAITGARAEELLPVVEAFRRKGRSFLSPPPEVPLDRHSLIDISHESLIRNWERLKEWVEEETQSRRTYLRLSESARLYYQGSAAALRGPDLALALRWREGVKPNQAWAARYSQNFAEVLNLLDESHRLEQEEVEQETRRRRRSSTLMRSFILSLVVGFVASVGLAFYAYKQKVEADGQRAAAALAAQEAQRQKDFAEQKAAEAMIATRLLEEAARKNQEELERARQRAKR